MNYLQHVLESDDWKMDPTLLRGDAQFSGQQDGDPSLLVTLGVWSMQGSTNLTVRVVVYREKRWHDRSQQHDEQRYFASVEEASQWIDALALPEVKTAANVWSPLHTH